MQDTVIHIRTDKKLKSDAIRLFDSLGMNLSTAVNMFLKQAVLKQQYPCSIDLELAEGNAMGYPSDFFSLFGAGNELGFDDEPADPAPVDDMESL